MACPICGKLNVSRDPCEHQPKCPDPSRDGVRQAAEAITNKIGDLADAVHAAVDEAVRRGLPEDVAIAHLAVLARTWSAAPAIIRTGDEA